MSLPRPIHPNTRYLVSRRITQRQLLLRPGAKTNQIILYVLAYAAKVSGVTVHAFIAMSNHIHCVVTDPLGNLPRFLHALDRLIACCMNALLGRRETLWNSEPPSFVALEDDDDVIDRIAYVIANPTRAGLVSDPAEWPGVITPVCGIRMVIDRPAVFFSKKGKMPVSIELSVVPPELASCADVHDVLARTRAVLDEKLRIARAEVAESGRPFLGCEAALAVDTSASASTPEPSYGRQPRLAARRIESRRSAFDRLRAFYASYAHALRRWREGNRSVVFPAGTYAMRIWHAALVDDVPE